jgi:formate dehydrogenase maturation protein FdhE
MRHYLIPQRLRGDNVTQFRNWPKVRDIRTAQCRCGCLLKWEMDFVGYCEVPRFFQDDNATVCVNRCPKCNNYLRLQDLEQNPKVAK